MSYPTPRWLGWSNYNNSAVEQTAGSHSLAAAAHLERWAARRSLMSIGSQISEPDCLIRLDNFRFAYSGPSAQWALTVRLCRISVEVLPRARPSLGAGRR